MTAIGTPIFVKEDPATTSVTVDLSTVASGDGVVLFAAQDTGSSPALTLADSTGWTAADVTNGWAGCSSRAWLFPSSGTLPASVTVNSVHSGIWVAAAFPVTGLEAFDVTPAYSSDPHDVDIPALTTVNDDVEVLVLLAAQQATQTRDWPAGLTEILWEDIWGGNQSASLIVAAASEVLGAAGLYGPWPARIPLDVPASRENQGYALPLRLSGGGATTTYDLTTATVGSGTVALNPAGVTHNDGTVVEVTATPAAGWTFSGWSGALSGTTNPQNVTMDADKTVTATFTEDPPDAPTGLTAVTGPAVALSWDAVVGASSYDLERNSVVIETGLTGTSHVDTAVVFDTEYSYRVRADEGGTKSAWTAAVTHTPTATAATQTEFVWNGTGWV